MNELHDKILEKVTNKDYIKKYAILAVALFISAINYNLFILPCKFVTGGASGVATITKYVFSIDPSLMTFLLSFIVLIFCYIFLGKEDTTAAGFTTIVYPLFIKATEDIQYLFIIDNESKLLMAIVAGIISGITIGLIYKIGLNNGGFGAISKIISKAIKQSVSKINFIVNMTIVIIGGYYFGINMILYAGIVLYISSIVSERILLGNSTNKMFYIISDKYRIIAEYLMDELKHDVTLFKVKGKFTLINKKAIMTIIPTREYFSVKEKIKEIDKKAFVIITDNYEVKGQDIKINSVNLRKKSLISRVFSDKIV